MIITPDKCPHCDNPAGAIVETLKCEAGIEQLEDGSFQYAGDSDMDYDSQKPLIINGKCTVVCERGHFYPAELED